MEGEVTMIIIDTSAWMKDLKTSCWFRDQTEAAEIYCERKLKAHPDNLIGIVTCGQVVLKPTDDLEHVRKGLGCLGAYGQCTDLLKEITRCELGWFDYQDMKKRIVVFAGGSVIYYDFELPEFVKLLKESRVVVDVVDFGSRLKNNEDKAEKLKALVNAMNDNNNENEDSRYFLIEDDGFSLSHHISSSSILPPLVAEEEVPIIRRPSKAKIHSGWSSIDYKHNTVEEELVYSGWSYGEEVVDPGWPYREEVVDSGWPYGEEVVDSGWYQEDPVGWD